MRDPASTQAFLEGEVVALEAFDFVTVEPTGKPLHRLEIGRSESQSLELRVPGRMPLLPALDEAEQSGLADRGFVNEAADDRTRSWILPVADAAGAVSLAAKIMQEVFNEKPDVALDILHGSHRAAHDALLKLAAVRERVERVITEAMGKKPEQDSDQDYLLPIGDVQVMVAPRVLPGGPAIVRVFAVTNVGVAVVPELGLFLARLNFGLMFGRFALDAENSSIWFDETLLGDQLNEEALKFAIDVVASTADEWDDRLKQMFGGMKFRETVSGNHEPGLPRIKPGEVPQDGPGQYI
jgi:hypothetical protein